MGLNSEVLRLEVYDLGVLDVKVSGFGVRLQASGVWGSLRCGVDSGGCWLLGLRFRRFGGWVSGLRV